MDFEQARFNMIEQQIRPWEVLDERVLELLRRTPREAFVPERYRGLAFADMHIPIGHGQVMMTPKVEARLLQALEIRPQDSILEVGTGSGYLTALLARLGRHVYSVDIFPDFTQTAKRKLAAQGVENVTLETGDAARGWDRHAPYDVILLTGSVPVLPDAFRRSLKPQGRLAAVIGRAPVMEATIIRRLGEEIWAQETVFETDLPPLLNAEQPSSFVF